LLAKPVLATLPAVLLLLDAWPLARAPVRWVDRDRWWLLVREKLPLLLPAVVVMLMTVAAQRGIGAVSSAEALPWSYRFTNAAVAYATYLRKMVWPSDLAVFYPYPATVSVSTLSISLALIALLSVLAWRAARARPYITVGWVWYVVTLVPMLGLVQVGSHSMADRFTYIPLIGVFVAIVWGAAEIAARWHHGLRVAAVAAGVAIVAASVTARAQVNTWRTSESLWSHALAVTDGNFRAHAGLAEVAAARGDTAQAIAHYRDALRLAPDNAEWHVNLALLLFERGQIDEAIASFRRALDLNPRDAKSHNSLGALLARTGKVDEAISHYRRALELSPDYPLARRNLDLALAAKK
jgi:protein O-mannosyl-transferase